MTIVLHGDLAYLDYRMIVAVEWIPLYNAPPPLMLPVITTNGKRVAQTYRTGPDEWPIWRPGEVTHWMPLPESPPEATGYKKGGMGNTPRTDATTYTNVADLRDPADPAGRSYRRVNAEKTHGIVAGSLVEIESGVRLFVVKLGRDCDQTPLYWLAPEMPAPTDEAEEPAYYRHLMSKMVGGYAEESLTVISPPSQGRG